MVTLERAALVAAAPASSRLHRLHLSAVRRCSTSVCLRLPRRNIHHGGIVLLLHSPRAALYPVRSVLVRRCSGVDLSSDFRVSLAGAGVHLVAVFIDAHLRVRGLFCHMARGCVSQLPRGD